MEESAPKIHTPAEAVKHLSEVPPVPKKNKSNKMLLIGFSIALGVVLVALGAYFFISQKTANQTAKVPVFTGEVVLGYNANQSAPGTVSFGISGRQGFELAIEEINASGGVLGNKIKPVILDDKADKEISKKNTEQLIFQDKALAIVGPANSANALNWIDIAQNNEVIVVSHIATATGITQKFKDRPRNYIFRVSSLDNEQTRFYIAWLLKKTNNGKIAIIHDSTSYGVGGAEDTTEVLARWGKTPVLVKEFDRKASIDDLVKVMQSVKAAGVDGLVFNALADSNANLLKALDRVEGYNPLIVGTAANLVPELWELVGPLAERIVFASTKAYEINERTESLSRKLAAKYKTTPTLSTAAQAYDVVYLLKTAIEKAGTLDRKAVRDALENIESMQGVMKLYDKPFSKTNHEGISIKDLVLLHWKNGKIVIIDEDISKLEIR